MPINRKMRITFLRLAFVPIFCCAVFFAPSWDPESVQRFVIQWAGYIMVLAGLGLRIWSSLYIGQRKSKELVATGPYSMCRNPLYVGTMVIVVGASLCMQNLIMGMVAVLIMVPVHLLVISGEEQHLEDIFGEDFLEYKRRTPKLWFALGKYASPATVDVPVKFMRRVFFDTLAVLLILPFADLIRMLQKANILPVIWYFP
ncbi:MAG: isoprenylcysteine carboxylmethyltransferase family protein [Phycisphaerae bacterium]